MAHKQLVNKETGEIITIRSASSALMTPPKLKEVTDLNTVAGKNPNAVNLRDNPQLSGREIIIMDAVFKESTLGGEKKSYVLLACYIPAPGQEPKQEDYTVVITGSENVQGRIADAEMAAGDGSPYPLRGTLRMSKGGRAWFLD